MTKLSNEIRQELSRYLAGDLQPADFRNWFAVVLRDVHKSNDPAAEELAHAVEWEFCDLERGVSPQQVRDNLRSMAEQPGVFVQAEAPLKNPTNYFHESISTGTSAIPDVPTLGEVGFVGVGRAVGYAS
jgi:hypothetical protein